jgi:hypothetical protein
MVESGFTPAALAFLAGVVGAQAGRGAAMGIYSMMLGIVESRMRRAGLADFERLRNREHNVARVPMGVRSSRVSSGSQPSA